MWANTWAGSQYIKIHKSKPCFPNSNPHKQPDYRANMHTRVSNRSDPAPSEMHKKYCEIISLGVETKQKVSCSETKSVVALATRPLPSTQTIDRYMRNRR